MESFKLLGVLTLTAITILTHKSEAIKEKREFND